MKSSEMNKRGVHQKRLGTTDLGTVGENIQRAKSYILEEIYRFRKVDTSCMLKNNVHGTIHIMSKNSLVQPRAYARGVGVNPS